MTFSLCLFLSFEPFSKTCLSTIVTEFISSKHLESFLISPDLEVYRKYFFWRGYLFMYSIVVGTTARTGHHSPVGWYFTRRVDQSDRIIGGIKDDSSSYGILITGVTLCKKVDKPNMNMPTLESLTHFLHSLSNNGVWKVAAGADCLGKLKISARDRLVARSGSSFTWLPSPWVLMEILLIHNLIWWYLRPFFGKIDCNFFQEFITKILVWPAPNMQWFCLDQKRPPDLDMILRCLLPLPSPGILIHLEWSCYSPLWRIVATLFALLLAHGIRGRLITKTNNGWLQWMASYADCWGQSWQSSRKWWWEDIDWNWKIGGYRRNLLMHQRLWTPNLKKKKGTMSKEDFGKVKGKGQHVKRTQDEWFQNCLLQCTGQGN